MNARELAEKIYSEMIPKVEQSSYGINWLEALLMEFREESKSEVGREVKFLKYGEDSPRVKKAVAQEREEIARMVEISHKDCSPPLCELAAQIRRRGEVK